MAIYKMVGDKERLDKVEPTSFGQEGVLERADLQRILRDKPEVLEEGLLIISEEFGNWQDSNRRIDLLALDSDGRLVVIELKRGETGAHMDLQAIRYAAMVANMTYEQVVDTYRVFLNKLHDPEALEDEDYAENRIREHLANAGPNNQDIYTEVPRIILASENFGKELTTCILWLNNSWLSNEGLDIKCVRLQPHRIGEDILLETSVVIPLPEAADYVTQLAKHGREARGQSSGIQKLPITVDFRENIDQVPQQFRDGLKRLHSWAVKLQEEGLVQISQEPRKLTLLVPGQERHLVSLTNLYWQGKDRGGEINLFPVWKDLAPRSRTRMDDIEAIGPVKSKDGMQHRRISKKSVRDNLDQILETIHDAYREANGLLVDDAPEPTVSESSLAQG